MVFKIVFSSIILPFVAIVVGQFIQGEENIVIINFDFDYAEFNKSLMLTQNELLERQKVLKKFMGQPAKVVKVSFVSQNKSRVSLWINVWWLSDDCLMTVWWLSDDCLVTVWWLSDDCLMTAWWLPNDCLMTVWWLYDDCQMTVWWHFLSDTFWKWK